MSFASPTKYQIGQVTWVRAEETFASGQIGSTDVFYAAPCELGTYHIENNSSSDVLVTIEASSDNVTPTWLTVTSITVSPGKSVDVPSEKFQRYWNPYIRACFLCEQELDGPVLISVVARGQDETGGVIRDKLDELIQKNEQGQVRTLVFRMKQFEAVTGYNMWTDTEDSDYIYVLEAPETATSTDTGFRGIRIPKGTTGLIGKIEVNEGATLTFDNRKTDGGWS